MSHWSKLLVLSGTTCAVTVGYVLYNEKENPTEEQEGELSLGESEESGLYSELKPPLCTTKVLKVSLVTTGVYLTWRLFATTARVVTFYGISLCTLLLNKTSMRVGRLKLGSILAAAGCFFTTAYFMQSVGTEVGWFLLCNALVGIPAAYCISQKLTTNQDLITRRLTSIRESDQFRDVLGTFSQQNLEAQWLKHDPYDKGLKVDEVKKIVDEIVCNMLNIGVDALENQCREVSLMNYIMGSIAPHLKDRSRVEKLSQSIFNKIDVPTAGIIYKEEFLTISETSTKTLKEMFSQSMSFTGAVGLARKFNRIGD